MRLQRRAKANVINADRQRNKNIGIFALDMCFPQKDWLTKKIEHVKEDNSQRILWLKNHPWYLLNFLIPVLIGIVWYSRWIEAVTGAIIYVLSYSILVPWMIFSQSKEVKTFSFSGYIFQALFLVVAILAVCAFGYYVPSENGKLIGSAMMTPGTPSEVESLYFSAVTFFTLGYGDIVPVGTFRYLAIFEVFLGVILMGTFFSFGVNLVHQGHQDRLWNPIKDSATRNIKSRLWNLSIDVLHMYRGSDLVFSTAREMSHEEISRAADENSLKQIDRILRSENPGDLIDLDVIKQYESIMTTGFEGLFSKYRESLDSLEIKYGRDLEAEKRILLMQVQNQLERLVFLFKISPQVEGSVFKAALGRDSQLLLKLLSHAKSLGLFGIPEEESV